jgi:NitT/TauT family transport system substrate-binding protein
VISTKASTIRKDPETVQKVVNATLKGLKLVQENKKEAYRILKKEFPTASEASLKASMNRAYKDNLWSKDGFISRASVDKPLDVVKQTGIYTGGYTYSKLVDMSFVNRAQKE